MRIITTSRSGPATAPSAPGADRQLAGAVFEKVMRGRDIDALKENGARQTDAASTAARGASSDKAAPDREEVETGREIAEARPDMVMPQQAMRSVAEVGRSGARAADDAAMPSGPAGQGRLAGIAPDLREGWGHDPTTEMASAVRGSEQPAGGTQRPHHMSGLAGPIPSTASDGPSAGPMASASASWPSTAKTSPEQDRHGDQSSLQTADQGSVGGLLSDTEVDDRVTAHAPTHRSAPTGNALGAELLRQPEAKPGGTPADGQNPQSEQVDASELVATRPAGHHSQSDPRDRGAVDIATTSGGDGAAPITALTDLAFPTAGRDIGAQAAFATQNASHAVEVSLHNSTAAPSPGTPLARQLVDAILRSGVESGQTELVLSPEELGKVQFSIRNVDGQLSVVISADRPDTLSLLRRNADLLAAELSQSGMGHATLDFGGGQSRDHGTHQPPDTAPNMARAQDRPPAPPGLEQGAGAIRSIFADGRLNIRL